MKNILLILVVLVFCSPVAFAQASSTDIQLRVLNHFQEVKEGKQVGWAAWLIIPNTLNTRPVRGLAVGGVALRDKKKTRWIEFMGGAFMDSAGNVNPVFDMRTAQNSKYVGLSQEVLYDFKAKRVLIPTTATTPLPVLKKLKLRVGSDSDIVHDRNGWHAGLGPRVSVVVPKTSGKLVLATAWQKGLHNQRNVWRTYVVVNW